MPHQCTDCGRTFDDGSKEMLSGCPDCGGNKFQFHPDGVDSEPDPSARPPDPPEAEMGVEGSVAKTVGNAATAVRDLVGSSPSPPESPDSTERPSNSDGRPAPQRPSASVDADDVSHRPSKEDVAQASARSDVVSPDELPPAPETPKTQPKSRPSPVLDDAGEALNDDAEPPADEERDRPALSELRAELNDQFESIKVLEPGQYELNLMELYDREEYIIALQEDGKYTIQVPERWKDE